jgi:hypothetical protein
MVNCCRLRAEIWSGVAIIMMVRSNNILFEMMESSIDRGFQGTIERYCRGKNCSSNRSVVGKVFGWVG